MPLTFNDKLVTDDQINTYIREKLPRNKDAIATFVLCNARPMERITEKGERVLFKGGTRAIQMSCIATIDGMQGQLVYWKTKGHIQVKGGGVIDNYEPKYQHFRNHEMNFNPHNDKPLFAFMLMNSRFKDNADKIGGVPEYQLVDTSVASTKKVSGTNAKLEAYDLVREAFDKNKAKIRSLYQSLGKTNFQELRAAQDWDSILEPIYSMCESNPKKIVELLKSAALEVGAKVMQAIESGVLKQDAQGFYWATGGKKIWTIPQGKGEEAFDLFVNFIRNEDKSGVIAQITKELDIVELTKTV